MARFVGQKWKIFTLANGQFPAELLGN